MQSSEKQSSATTKQKKKLSSPAIYSSIGGNPSSRTPSLQRTKSDPGFHTPKLGQLNLNDSSTLKAKTQQLNIIKLNISDDPTSRPLKPLKKRVMTVPTNLSAYHHPEIVLNLLLNLPMECHMGIGDNLKPLIDEAIAEQKRLEHLELTQLQQQQQIQQQQQKTPQEPHELNEDDHKDYQQVGIVPAAPLAIPPTAPMTAGSTITFNTNQTSNDPFIDSLDDFGFGDEVDIDHQHKKSSPMAMRRRHSIKQFESVLQEGYTRNLMIAVTQALFGAFLSGYNTSVLNTPADVIKTQCHLDHDSWRYATLQSAFCAGGLIGALSIGKVADSNGRKVAIAMFDIMFIMSGLAIFAYVTFTDKYINNYWLFVVSRILSGVGAGIATAIIPTYLGEISPPLIRGAIGTLNQLTVCIGLLAAEFLGAQFIFGTSGLWPWLFILNIAFPIIQFCTFWAFPESPKWLITVEEEDKAREALQWLRECDNVDMDLHFTKLASDFQQAKRKRTLSRPSLLSVHTISSQLIQNKNNQNYGSIEVTDNVHSVQQSTSLPANNDIDNIKEAENKKLVKKIIGWSITIAISLQLLQQFSGINSVFYYSDQTLKSAGLTSKMDLWIGNIAIALANLLSVFIPVYLMDKWGRKKLLNVSLVGMIIASVLFSIFLNLNDKYGENGENEIYGYLSVASLIFYVVSFELGLGPIPWLMMAEITPSSHRAKIVSVATFFNWGSNLCIAQFANDIVNKAQFFPFAIVCIFGMLFIKFVVPETKGKTEMQIQQELIKSKH